MADNVNIIVQDTINEIVVNAAVVVETIDINVQTNIDEVQIIANPNNYVVNINRIIGEQVQSDWTQTDNQAPDYIKNKPSIPAAQVNSDWDATTGVAEILNKPTIPAAQVNSDWDATTGVAQILNKPTLATVATSGSYNDLINKPTIPTATSDLTNDGSDGVNPFITAADIPPVTGFVPYTGATSNVDLGTHTLSAKDLVINHSSGNGVAASITKGGAGEALTINKTSGSGNAMSVTGGVTQLDELHLTTDLADSYIASAVTWNGKFTLPALTSGSVLFSNGTTIAQDNSNLFWDDTNNRLGIGTNNPTAYYAKKLVVACPDEDGVTILANTVSSTNYLAFADGVTGNEAFRGYVSYKHQTDQLTFGSAGTLRMTIASTGNVLIGTTTDAGFKLDVNGTARIANKLSVGTPSAASALMEITSTTLGFLPPRMTNAQKLAITTPAAGLVVYDTTLNKLCVRTASSWETITSI